ncbi:MAG: S8 family serine peptidase [Thermoplasmatota archaeon]
MPQRSPHHVLVGVMGAILLLAGGMAAPAWANGATGSVSPPMAAGDRAIVSLADGSPLPSVPGVTVERTYTVFPGALVVGAPRALELLALAPGVLGVYPDSPLELHLDLARAAIGLAGTGAPNATGAGVTVAVVDTGIDAQHPGLAGRVTDYAVSSAGVVPEPTSSNSSSHGTMVAGIVGGSGAQSPDNRYRGIAPQVQLVGLDISQELSVDGALAAFDWLHQNGAANHIRIVTNSWGTAGVPDGHFDPSAPLVRASNTLVLTDHMVMVFSAGNRGTASSIGNEALNPNVITVGATDAGGRLAPFSSRGPGLNPFGQAVAWTKPDLVAPGMNIVSASQGTGVPASDDRSLAPAFYRQDSGTSFAAPMVAGTAALLLETRSNLTPAQIHRILTVTARPLGNVTPNNDTGYGLLDARAAVALAASPNGSIPGGLESVTLPESYASTVVVLGGNVVQNPSPPNAVAGSDVVGYIPVLPGAAALDAQASWSSQTPSLLGGSPFTAQLYDPQGSPGPTLATDATSSGVSATVTRPTAGIWQLRVTPASAAGQAALTLIGSSDGNRVLPPLSIGAPSANVFAAFPSTGGGSSLLPLILASAALVLVWVVAGTILVLRRASAPKAP